MTGTGRGRRKASRNFPDNNYITGAPRKIFRISEGAPAEILNSRSNRLSSFNRFISRKRKKDVPTEIDGIPITEEDEAVLEVESIMWSWLGGKPVGGA